MRRLSKSFGGFRAVDGVSLDVEAGHVHSLIGPNGAGKTTVFNCISGFLRPNAGQIVLNDREITGSPPHRLVAAGLARRREGRDRRSVAVELTPAGHAAAAEAVKAPAEALEEALADLDQEERAELARLHAKVLTTLTDGRATAGHICRLCDSHACGHEEGRCPVTQAADAAEGRAAAANAPDAA